MNGTRVTHLAAGTYEIQVHDNSAFHNFHLNGPGVDQTTEVDFTWHGHLDGDAHGRASTSSSATRTRAS